MKEYIKYLRSTMKKPEHEECLPYGLEGSLADELSQPALWELASAYEE